MPAEPAVYEPMLPLAAVAGDGAWSPHVDVRELPDGYIGLADLPGVQPGAIAVTACPHQRRSELRPPGGR